MTQPDSTTPNSSSPEASTEAPKLQPGDAFPAFSLPDAQGQVHTLNDSSGKYLVLYVYPKDNTPGCTREACDFRDNMQLKQHGAQVLGLSMDDAASHQQFAQEHSLPFPLLSDPSADFLKTIGAYGTKNMYGKVSQGVKRTTFLVGPDGKLVKAWYAVSVDGHSDAVVKAIEADQAKP